MRHIPGLRLLGLCFVAALALAAFSAVSAQAAEWLTQTPAEAKEEEILKKVVSKSVSGKVPIEIEPDVMLTFISTTGATNTPVEILCENEDLLEGFLEAAGKASGKLSFTECKTFLSKMESKVCAPQEPIVSNVLTAEAFDMGGVAYALIKPTTGTSLAEIKFPNKECTLNPSREVSGTAVIKDCKKESTKLLIKHLVEEASESLFASGDHLDSLKLGTPSSVKNAHFTGSVLVKLAGGFIGDNFAAMLP